MIDDIVVSVIKGVVLGLIEGLLSAYKTIKNP